ncbi:MAG: hypothetical protein ACTS3F_10665 [Phycisphaerales bacterium]
MLKKMSQTLTPAILIAACAMPAIAQDSVSNVASPQPAGASDALSPYIAAQACENYVLDLVPFTGSWGTKYAVGPLLKSNKTQAQFENSFLSAQAISANYSQAQIEGMYAGWNTPGAGINPEFNNPPMMFPISANTLQFGAAAIEFGGNANNVLTAVANFEPSDPTRLYVTRYTAATNGNNATENSAQLGGISIDSEGVVSFRADNVGTIAPAVAGNNLLTVRSLDRNCQVINKIGPAAGSGDPGATTFHISGLGSGIVAPNIFPSKFVGGGVPLTTGFNFDLIVGGLPAQPFGNTNTRGGVGYASNAVLGSAVGVASASILTKDAADNTRVIQIGDLDANGNAVGNWQQYVADSSQFGALTPLLTGTWEFGHYFSQTPFRGGAAQTDIGVDAQGNTLALAVALATGGSPGASTVSGLVAMRDADQIANGNEQWTLVAVNSFPGGRSNPVLDGPGGNVVGYVSNLLDYTVIPQFAPSISTGSFDAAGNIWFVCPVEFVDDPNQPFEQANVEIALLRAVYSPATFTYELEAIVKTGDIFAGANSGTEYLVSFIETVDADSISSGAFWSSNAMDTAFANTDPTTFEPASNLSTGGVVLNAEIVYDRNNDGFFSFNSNMAGDDDEGYQVLLFIGPDAEVTPICECPGDVDGNCTTDSDDLGILLGNFGSTVPSGTGGDLDNTTFVDSNDLAILLSDFGCQG